MASKKTAFSFEDHQEDESTERPDNIQREQPPLGIVQRRRMGLLHHPSPPQLPEKPQLPPHPLGVALAKTPPTLVKLVQADTKNTPEKEEIAEKKQPDEPFDIAEWFSQLELRFREVVSECAEQLTEKHEYFHDDQSGYKLDRFLGFFTPIMDVTDDSYQQHSSAGDAAPAFFGGGFDGRRPSVASSPSHGAGPGYYLAGTNPSGFAAFAFSHALLETASTLGSDSKTKGIGMAATLKQPDASSLDRGTEFNLRAVSLGLSADCLLRNYYASQLMVHHRDQAREEDSYQGLQQTALSYWKILKASLTSSTKVPTPQMGATSADTTSSIKQRRTSSTSSLSASAGGFKRSNSGATALNLNLEAAERRCSDRLAIWFSSHELVGVFSRNHSQFGQLLALQHEARTRVAMAAKMEREVMDRDGLGRLTLSTYLDIMRLGPIFAGFEYPIFGTFLLSRFATSSATNELSPIEEANFRQILRDVGEYLIIRQQYCDVFGEGRLVRNGRLSWPLAVAVGQADEDQLAALATFYGSGTSAQPVTAIGPTTTGVNVPSGGDSSSLNSAPEEDDDAVFYSYRHGSTSATPEDCPPVVTPSLAPSYVARVRRVLRDIGVPEKFREWERAAKAHSSAEIHAASYLDPHVTHALEIFFEQPFLAMTNCHFQSMTSLMAGRKCIAD